MSHFTVLVTKTQAISVDEQLEPFYEQGEDGDYFMERHVEVEAGKLAEALEYIAAQKLDCHKRALKSRKTARAVLAKRRGGSSGSEIERAEREASYEGHYLREAKELGALAGTGGTDAQKAAIQEWYGGDWDDDGNLFHVLNPNARWDWYAVGGRWTGYFKLKPGATGKLGEPGVVKHKPDFDADICRVGDIDWAAIGSAARKRAEKRWAAYEAAIADGEEMDPYFDFGVGKGDTKGHYLRRLSSPATFAVLHDGQWHESGQMGWWGLVSDEKAPDDWNAEFEGIIASLDPDDEVTVVDCHI